MSVDTCVHAHTQAHICTHMCAHMCIHAHIHKPVRTHVWVQVCTLINKDNVYSHMCALHMGGCLLHQGEDHLAEKGFAFVP